MNITKLALSISVLTLAAVSMAQVSGRSFSYKPSDTVDQDFSAQGDITLKARTRVTVNPYLYVKGNLGAEWVVDGWGSGTDERTESIKFFHNETLTLSLDQFDNPAKISGTKTGAQAVDLDIDLAFFNDQANKQIHTSGRIHGKDVNGKYKPAGPAFDVDSTGGVMRLELSRKISINPNVGPGVYENVGLITVIRN